MNNKKFFSAWVKYILITFIIAARKKGLRQLFADAMRQKALY